MSDNSLMAEYELVQGKLDKIGDFMFTIKGWTVTVVSGILVGDSALGLPPGTVLVALPVIAVFWAQESRQLGLRSSLSRRAIEIENAMDKDRRTSPASDGTKVPSIRSPGVAQALARGHRNASRAERVARWVDGHFYLVALVLVCMCAVTGALRPKGDTKAQDNLVIINNG